MKKSFVAVALVMGLGTTVAFAENLTSGVETEIGRASCRERV